MVQLSKERILEFQKIFKEEYGKELSFAEAEEAANNLVGFFDLLLKIDRRNKNKLKNQKIQIDTVIKINYNYRYGRTESTNQTARRPYPC